MKFHTVRMLWLWHWSLIFFLSCFFLLSFLSRSFSLSLFLALSFFVAHFPDANEQGKTCRKTANDTNSIFSNRLIGFSARFQTDRRAKEKKSQIRKNDVTRTKKEKKCVSFSRLNEIHRTPSNPAANAPHPIYLQLGKSAMRNFQFFLCCVHSSCKPLRRTINIAFLFLANLNAINRFC